MAIFIHGCVIPKNHQINAVYTNLIMLFIKLVVKICIIFSCYFGDLFVLLVQELTIPLR